MIKEDYVSFDIAKLLKEKGFDEKCSHYWQNETSEYSMPKEIYKWTDSALANTEISDSERFSAPTQSLALKWLREVHNIVIEINMDDYMTTTDGKLKVTYSYMIWTFIQHLGETGLTDARYDDRAFWQENVKVGQSYEEAVEAAIEYCLENLI